MPFWIRCLSCCCLLSAVLAAEEAIDPGGAVGDPAEDTLEQLLPADEQAPVPAPAISPLRREIEHLLERGLFERAERVVDAHLTLHPGDTEARQLLLRIEIAEREDSIRRMVAEQADMHGQVLGHPDYEAEKALVQGLDRQRLDMVEYLVSLQEYERALALVNTMLDSHPDNRAALQIKSRLLERIQRRERERIERERAARRLDALNDVIAAGIPQEDPEPIPRTVLIFDEDIAATERRALMDKLSVDIPRFQQAETPLAAVLDSLFRIAGIDYVINDEALGEETLTLNVQDATVEDILTIVQRMLPVRFNYHAGSIYVTDLENTVLMNDIYRLKAGLTDVQRVTGARGGGGGGAEGGGISIGGGGEGQSDLERFLEVVPELVEWPEGSRLWLERKSNTVFIRSSPSTVQEVKRLLRALDYNSVQVLVETKFVEVSDNAEKQLGINWAFAGQNSQGENGNISWGGASGAPINPLEGEAGLLSALTSGSGGLTLGTVGFGTDVTPNFSTTLRALEDKNQAHLLSEPKILTLSNSTGVISIVRGITYIEGYDNLGVNSTIVLNDGNNEGDVNLNPIVPRFGQSEEGFVLVVTPSVARNSDIITMHLTPRITEVELRRENFASAVAGATVDFPIESPIPFERSLETTLHIRDGQTIVLGGLITESTSEGRTGIPGISDVPGLGRLFRTDSRNSRRSKLLIFVSAHIIDPSGSKLSDEVRHLRDTASVVLPADVRAASRARALEARQAARDTAAQRQADAAVQEEGVVRRPGKGPR